MAKKVNITPLADRVLVRPLTEDEVSEATSSGIIIPETVTQEKSGQGEVIAVGEGKLENGERIPVAVSVGDRVVFNKYSYEEVKYAGETYYILSESNLLAIIA